MVGASEGLRVAASVVIDPARTDTWNKRATSSFSSNDTSASLEHFPGVPKARDFYEVSERYESIVQCGCPGVLVG